MDLIKQVRKRLPSKKSWRAWYVSADIEIVPSSPACGCGKKCHSFSICRSARWKVGGSMPVSAAHVLKCPRGRHWTLWGINHCVIENNNNIIIIIVLENGHFSSIFPFRGRHGGSLMSILSLASSLNTSRNLLFGLPPVPPTWHLHLQHFSTLTYNALSD